MHPAGHLINTFIVRGFVTLVPVYLLGLPPRVSSCAFLVMGIHRASFPIPTSICAGWLNYLFVGPELHRYHHSADVKEAGNYATALSILADVFLGPSFTVSGNADRGRRRGRTSIRAQGK